MSPLYAVEAARFNSSGGACDCLVHRFGNAADQPDRVRAYDTDLADAEWREIRPLLPVPAWLEGYCYRVMLDAVFYVVDNGIKWRNMPVASLPGTGSMRSGGAGADPG